MIGTQFAKPLQDDYLFDEQGNRSDNPAANTCRKYAEAAAWCNERNATIEDKGDYYEVVAIPEPEPVPEPTEEELLAQAKSAKLSELNTKFSAWREDGATLVSSLGFEADADEKANDDVSGLVILGKSATFMDADNQPHVLTIDQLKVLQTEIIESGVAAYETKWAYRNAVNSATTVDAVNAIEIKFEPKDFTTSN